MVAPPAPPGPISTLRSTSRSIGGGNGPYYTAPGVVYTVTGSDPYRLDADNDGMGCESG